LVTQYLKKMGDENETWKQISNPSFILPVFFTSILYILIQPSFPKKIQLDFNLSLKGLNCVNKKFEDQIKILPSIIKCKRDKSKCVYSKSFYRHTCYEGSTPWPAFFIEMLLALVERMYKHLMVPEIKFQVLLT